VGWSGESVGWDGVVRVWGGMEWWQCEGRGGGENCRQKLIWKSNKQDHTKVALHEGV